MFSGIFLGKSFLNLLSGMFFWKVWPESFFRKFSGKFFKNFFWKYLFGNFYHFCDFLGIFRQYKSLGFFLDFYKIRFWKQVWTVTFPEMILFAISHPYCVYCFRKVERHWNSYIKLTAGQALSIVETCTFFLVKLEGAAGYGFGLRYRLSLPFNQK